MGSYTSKEATYDKNSKIQQNIENLIINNNKNDIERFSPSSVFNSTYEEDFR